MAGDFENFIVELREWQKETFPYATTESTKEHLRREALELQDAVGGQELAAEIADVFILLLQLADMEGFSLFQAAHSKFEQLKKRAWKAPDEFGVVEHVKGDSE